VQSEDDELPIATARVQIVGEEATTSAITSDDGLAVFEILTVGTYSVTVTAEGYAVVITTITLEDGANETTLVMTVGIFVRVMADNSNLRAGPGTTYDSVGVVNEGEMLQVLGRSDDSEWLVVQTIANEEAWIATSLVEDEVLSGQIPVVDVPATPTAVATTIAVQPTAPPPAALPQAAPPTGTNLLVNPGFESGETGWNRRGPTTFAVLTPADGHAQFVHEGAWSILVFEGVYFQNVEGVSSGQTYRAGGWVKIWSSTDDDRTISQNPGDYVARICINVDGDDHPALESNVCSGFVQPLDVWQYIAVDAVAANERITVALQVFFNGPTRVKNNEAYWDNVTLGGSPVMATATPVPFDPTVRPDPVPFTAAALIDSMNNVRSAFEQMGGLLDRLVNGSTETCLEYDGYYEQLGRSALYDSIPEEWQSIYNDYVFAIDHGLGSNDGIYSYCQNGTGAVTQHSYGTARQGINDSLDRLNPAIDLANSLLGG
jgi:uncharacterized protein YraI